MPKNTSNNYTASAFVAILVTSKATIRFWRT